MTSASGLASTSRKHEIKILVEGQKLSVTATVDGQGLKNLSSSCKPTARCWKAATKNSWQPVDSHKVKLLGRSSGFSRISLAPVEVQPTICCRPSDLT